MADIVNFTLDARTVTGTGPCEDKEILDLAGYTSLQLALRALVIESGGSLTLRLETSMSRYGKDDQDWISLGVFTPVTPDALVDGRRFDGILRYVRWRVDRLDGAKAIFLLGGYVLG